MLSLPRLGIYAEGVALSKPRVPRPSRGTLGRLSKQLANPEGVALVRISPSDESRHRAVSGTLSEFGQPVFRVPRVRRPNRRTLGFDSGTPSAYRLPAAAARHFALDRP